jgi:hypothetical protein
MHYTYEIVVLPAIIKITIVINNILNIFVSDIFVRVSNLQLTRKSENKIVYVII